MQVECHGDSSGEAYDVPEWHAGGVEHRVEAEEDEGLDAELRRERSGPVERAKPSV
jgi:hypothetical protein